MFSLVKLDTPSSSSSLSLSISHRFLLLLLLLLLFVLIILNNMIFLFCFVSFKTSRKVDLSFVRASNREVRGLTFYCICSFSFVYFVDANIFCTLYISLPIKKKEEIYFLIVYIIYKEQGENCDKQRERECTLSSFAFFLFKTPFIL